VDISLNFDNGDGFDMGDVTDNSSVAMETDAPVAKEAPEPQAETAAGKPVCALQVPYATDLRLGSFFAVAGNSLPPLPVG
jgi:hypothetical protein